YRTQYFSGFRSDLTLRRLHSGDFTNIRRSQMAPWRSSDACRLGKAAESRGGSTMPRFKSALLALITSICALAVLPVTPASAAGLAEPTQNLARPGGGPRER